VTAAARPERRLLPEPTRESRPFWTGGQNGQLLIYRCHNCSRFFHPPAPACWRCRGRDVGPEPVSGTGRIAAYTVNRQPWIPGFEPPYIVAMVELDDEPDVRLTTNVVGAEVDALTIGTRVTVCFENTDDIWVPLFTPVPETAARL
jgi:uncharacterized OB-fold protein